MKRHTVPAATILGLALFMLGAATKNTEAPTGVAIVNINAVLGSMPEYIKNDSLLGREYLTYQTEIQTLRGSLQAESESFNQRTLSMTPVAKENERRKLQAKADSIQAKADGYQQKIGERRDELLGPLEDRATAILESLRAEGNYSAVLNVAGETNVVVVADKSVNLTDKAIERLRPAAPATGKP